MCYTQDTRPLSLKEAARLMRMPLTENRWRKPEWLRTLIRRTSSRLNSVLWDWYCDADIELSPRADRLFWLADELNDEITEWALSGSCEELRSVIEGRVPPAWMNDRQAQFFSLANPAMLAAECLMPECNFHGTLDECVEFGSCPQCDAPVWLLFTGFIICTYPAAATEAALPAPVLALPEISTWRATA